MIRAKANLILIFLCNTIVLQAVNTKDLIVRRGSPEYIRIMSLIASDKKIFAKEVNRLQPKSILFLGDKQNSEDINSYSLSRKHHEFLQSKKIRNTLSDIACQNHNDSSTGIQERKVNHTKVFPFPNHSFDMIIGRKQLCNCDPNNSGVVCGGPSIKSPNSFNIFFGEIARVLSKGKNSVAFIHGSYHQSSKHEDQAINEHIYKARKAVLANSPDINFFRVIYENDGQNIRRIGTILGNAGVWKETLAKRTDNKGSHSTFKKQKIKGTSFKFGLVNEQASYSAFKKQVLDPEPGENNTELFLKSDHIEKVLTEMDSFYSTPGGIVVTAYKSNQVQAFAVAVQHSKGVWELELLINLVKGIDLKERILRNLVNEARSRNIGKPITIFTYIPLAETFFYESLGIECEEKDSSVYKYDEVTECIKEIPPVGDPFVVPNKMKKKSKTQKNKQR